MSPNRRYSLLAYFRWAVFLLLLAAPKGLTARSPRQQDRRAPTIDPLLEKIFHGPDPLGPAALWERFVGHLRAGRLRKAYECFSPLSQQAYSFQQFCTHYNPLTAASEATLRPANDGQLRLSGGLAVFRFAAAASVQLANGEKKAGIMVTALMIQEGGRWHLVAAPREAAARTEAEARNLLRRLWRAPGFRQAVARGQELRLSEIRQAAPELFNTGEAALCLHAYDFSLKRLDQGLALGASPRRPGLRSFMIAKDRGVEVVESKRAPPGRPVVPAVPSREDEPAGNTSRSRGIESPFHGSGGEAAGERNPAAPKINPEKKPAKSAVPELPPPPPDMGDPAAAAKKPPRPGPAPSEPGDR